MNLSTDYFLIFQKQELDNKSKTKIFYELCTHDLSFFNVLVLLSQLNILG
jgi:hypothetical protein